MRPNRSCNVFAFFAPLRQSIEPQFKDGVRFRLIRIGANALPITAHKDGYSVSSIVAHWIAAVIVVILFVTHEGERGSAAYALHVGGGAIAGIFLLWRVWHRLLRGETEKPNQARIFNIASQIVIWGLLAAIAIVVITGYLVPWTEGQPLDIFGLIAIPSPISANRAFAGFVEEVHEIAGQSFLPLLALHILGSAKHALIDRDGVISRMLKPVIGGR